VGGTDEGERNVSTRESSSAPTSVPPAEPRETADIWVHKNEKRGLRNQDTTTTKLRSSNPNLTAKREAKLNLNRKGQTASTDRMSQNLLVVESQGSRGAQANNLKNDDQGNNDLLKKICPTETAREECRGLRSRLDLVEK